MKIVLLLSVLCVISSCGFGCKSDFCAIEFEPINSRVHRLTLSVESPVITLRGDSTYFQAIKLPAQNSFYTIIVKSYFNETKKGHFVSPQFLAFAEDKVTLNLTSPEMSYLHNASGERPYMLAVYKPHQWTKQLIVSALTGAPMEEFNSQKIQIAERTNDPSLPASVLNTILVKSPTGEIELTIQEE